MAVVDVRSFGEWSNAATNHSEMVSSYCDVSVPLLTPSIRLAKLEADSTFMILQPFWFRAFVFSGLNCPDCGLALPDSRLTRDSVWRVSSCSDADWFLAQ